MNAFYENRVNELKLWYRNTLAFLPHFHDSFEIVLLLKGEVDAVVDGEKHTLLAGEVLLVLPNSVHSYSNEKDVEAYLYIVPRRYAHAFSSEFDNSTVKRPILKSNENIVSLFRSIAAVNRTPTPYKAQMWSGYFTVLFAECLSKIELVKCNKSGFETDRKIISYCLSNFRHDISLDSISKELHISKNHISYIFSSKLKTSLPEFIGSLRTEEAKRLIENGASMTDAALNSGFSSIRTFNRRFFAETGMTPKEYAKSVKK